MNESQIEQMQTQEGVQEMSNIITEHRYEAARWGDLEYDAILSGKFLPGEIIDLHNATIIKLQGDHDEEVELLRHQIADLKRDLNYARAAVSVLKHRGE